MSKALAKLRTQLKKARYEGIAWRDVRRAFATVPHVHISAVMHDPQRVTRDDDNPPDYEGLEFYYQSPNRYRGHGRGLVHFVTQDVSRVYDTKGKAFLTPDDYRKIIPEALLKEIGKSPPDLRRRRDLCLLKQRSNGTYTWDDAQRRSAVYSQWQGYHRALWQLKKAKASRASV